MNETDVNYVAKQANKGDAMKGKRVDWSSIDFGNIDHNTQTELFQRSRESLTGDPYRPVYHFSPPGADLHDTAGICWWEGKFHLFYLLSTPNIKWGRGHAVSEDLVHWKDLSIAGSTIYGGTGQVWADKKRVILGYATNKHKDVSLATASDPLLQDWVAHPKNPVYTPTPPPNANPERFATADNYIWRENNTYYMTIRHYHHDPELPVLAGNTALEICRSKSLENWESMGLLFDDGHFTEPGEDCACNSFLPLGNGKHLLIFFSHKRSSQYYVGRFDQDACRFHIENHGRMCYGPVSQGSLHAPSAFIDPSGRCIAVWNVTENRKQDGWEQLVSLPRSLSINKEGSVMSRHLYPLLIEPIEELNALRSEQISFEKIKIAANSEFVLSGVEGQAMEIDAVIDPMESREVGLNILRSPEGEEQTTITLFNQKWRRNQEIRELGIDVSRTSLDPMVRARPPEIGRLYIEEDEPLRLRVFIDRSVVEVFANGRQCLTVRVYPSLRESRGVSVFTRGRDAKLVSLNAFRMRSIWPELK